MAEQNVSQNEIGLILALSSSIFIGTSFIVKKKGLIRARSSGVGAASAGGFAYLKESLWWIGLFAMIFGEFANFAAYTFAPAILVTPLGALSVIISAILASVILKERLALVGKVGCALCVIGSTVIVLNAPAEEEITSVDQMTEKMETNLAFQLYVVFVVVLSTFLIYYVCPKIGNTNVLVYVTICSLIGSVSVIACKALGIALKLSFEGNNQMQEGSTWFFGVVVLLSVVTQMNYLNKALDTFNTAVVTPIYYVIFTTSTIIASAILFRGWADPVVPSAFGTPQFLSVLCGFLTICGGVFILHLSRESDVSGDRRGAHVQDNADLSLIPKGIENNDEDPTGNH